MAAGVVMVELPPMERSNSFAAIDEFSSFGFNGGRLLEVWLSDSESKYFMVFDAQKEMKGCETISFDGETQPLAWLHGTDCDMSKQIPKDLDGKVKSTTEYCSMKVKGDRLKDMKLPKPPKEPKP
jgi:hypothetical protein